MNESRFSLSSRASIAGDRTMNRSSTKPGQSRFLGHGDGFWGSGFDHSLVQTGKNTSVFVETAIENDLVQSRPVHMKLFKEWAWFVSDRVIMVWKHSTSVSSPSRSTTTYFELKLPATGLVHRTELIEVFAGYEGCYSCPSCLAVTPEGKVLFWPRLDSAHLFFDVSLDLSGQECESLVSAWPVGFFLATTSGNVIFLGPAKSGSSMVVNHRPLRLAQGIFSGVRRRMTNIIFGSYSVEKVQRIVRVCASKAPENDWLDVYVLVGFNLKKWKTSPDLSGYDELALDFDVERMLKETYADHFKVGTDDVCVWVLDLALCKQGVILLSAGSLSGQSRQSDRDHIQIGFGILDLKRATRPPEKFSKFRFIPVQEAVSPKFETVLASFRILATSDTCVVYHPRSLCCVSLNDGPGKSTTVLETGSDKLLGYGLSAEPDDEESAMFFYSHGYGSVKLVKNYVTLREQTELQDTTEEFVPKRGRRTRFAPFPEVREVGMEESASDMETSSRAWNDSESTLESTSSVYRRAKSFENVNVPGQVLDNMLRNGTAAVKLKAAVIHFARGNEATARDIVQRMLPPGSAQTWAGTCDALVDKIVASCSKENILDDFPAQDKRWKLPSADVGVGYLSSSMVLNTQVKDKIRAHGLFVEFLEETKLLNLLATINVDDRLLATRHYLGENAEKLAVADTLLDNKALLEPHFADIVKDVASDVEDRSDQLVPKAHVFFRKVSAVDLFFLKGIRSWLDHALTTHKDSEFTNMVLAATKITGLCLEAILNVRVSNLDLYVIAENVDFNWEFFPWTSTPAFREFLRDLITLATDYGACDETNVTVFEFSEPLMTMVDFLLDGYVNQLKSMKPGSRHDALEVEYVSARSCLLRLLFDRGDTRQSALEKAEEYRDFDLLCRYSFQKPDYELLNRYADFFKDYEFTKFAVTWLMKRKLSGQVVDFVINVGGVEHIREYPMLYWAYLSKKDMYFETAQVLLGMIEREDALAERKMSMVGVARLHMRLLQEERRLNGTEMTAAEKGLDDRLRYEAELLAHQEKIPASLLALYGMRGHGDPPMKVEEIVQAYAGPQNKDATPAMLIEAFKVSDFFQFDRDYIQTVRRYIWASAALRDDWSKVDEQSPGSLRETFLYTVAEELFSSQTVPEKLRESCAEAFTTFLVADQLAFLRQKEDQMVKLYAVTEAVVNDFDLRVRQQD